MMAPTSTRDPNLSAARRRLTEATAALFFDPAPFLKAFAEYPPQAIIALRDRADLFGPCRSYVGPLSLKKIHTACLAAARAHYCLTHGQAAVNATRRPRATK